MEKLIAELSAKINALVTATEEKGHKVESNVTDLQKRLEALETELKVIKQVSEMTGSVSKLDFFGRADTQKAERFLSWFKAVINPAHRKDVAPPLMVEGTEADGGFTVPDEFKPSLIRLVETYGLVAKYGTVISMRSNRLILPRLTSGVTVYWVGENKTITKSKAQGLKVILTAKKLAALVPLTDELLEDAALDIANLLINLIAEAMAKEEDRVSLAGSVAAGDPFNGVLFEVGVNEVVMAAGKTSFGDVTIDNLIDMEAKLTGAALVGATYFIHNTVLAKIKQLKDDEGRYIWTAPRAGQPGELNGYPYMVTDVMPGMAATGVSKTFLAFGNLRHIYKGDRKDLAFKIADHDGFADGVQYLRGINREALTVAIPEAFCRLKTAAA